MWRFLKEGIIFNRKSRVTYVCCIVYWDYVYTVLWVHDCLFLISFSEEELVISRTVTVTFLRTILNARYNTLVQRKVSDQWESALYLDGFSLKNMVTFLLLFYIFSWNHPNHKSNHKKNVTYTKSLQPWFYKNGHSLCCSFLEWKEFDCGSD